MGRFLRLLLLAIAALVLPLAVQPERVPAAGEAPGSWTSLATTRGAPAELVSLADGRVLFWDIGFMSYSASIFDPATDTFSTVAGLSGAAGYTAGAPTLTLLGDGRVLAASGQLNAESLVLDLATADFSIEAPMAVTRNAHAASLLTDGRVLVTGGYIPDGFDGTAIDSVEIYDPVTNTWSLAAPMTYKRTSHGSLTLPNGKVLVVGGLSIYDTGYATPADYVATAEVYDPATNTWSNAGTVPNGLFGPSAELLDNGKVLVVGGRNYGPTFSSLSVAVLYDFVTNSWTPTGSMISPRQNRAAKLSDGRVLIGGGVTGSSTSFPDPRDQLAEVYDPATGQWSAVAVMNEPRRNSTRPLLLGDGRVLYPDVGTNVGRIEVFDPAGTTPAPSGIWRTLPNTPGYQFVRNVNLLPDGTVIISSSLPVPYDAFNIRPYDRFNPKTEAWSTLALNQSARLYETMTLLKNGKLLVAGRDTSPLGQHAELYDPAANTWAPAGTMPGPLEHHAATLLRDGRVLVTGGRIYGAAEALSSTALYDPVLNTWSVAAPMAFKREEHSSLLLDDGRVLIVGGSRASIPGNAVFPVEIYDPLTNTWTTGASMSKARSHSSAVLMANGKVLVAGGYTLNTPQPNTLTADAELYDPVTDAWTPAASLHVARDSHDALLLSSGKVLVTGGTTNCCGAAIQDVEVYDPITDTWTLTDSLDFRRYDHTTILLRDRRGLIVGGREAVTSVELFAGDSGPEVDTDGDGYSDALEQEFNQYPGTFCLTMRAELTGDGFVNSGDQGKLASGYGIVPAPARLDQNADGIINSGDQGLVGSQYAKKILSCP
jgi:hypothetical protein